MAGKRLGLPWSLPRPATYCGPLQGLLLPVGTQAIQGGCILGREPSVFFLQPLHVHAAGFQDHACSHSARLPLRCSPASSQSGQQRGCEVSNREPKSSALVSFGSAPVGQIHGPSFGPLRKTLDPTDGVGHVGWAGMSLVPRMGSLVSCG